MTELVELLVEAALAVCPSKNKDWARTCFEQAASGSKEQVQLLFASAGRRWGRQPCAGSWNGGPSPTWNHDDLARVAALVTVSRVLSAQELDALVEDLYFRGTAGEKRAVLLALFQLKAPEQHLALAVEACRTNTVDVFEAIACENEFPYRYFDEKQFNQLVLKTLFLELDVKRIYQVKRRVTSSLQANLRDFKAEREAAGRTVPAGLFWLLREDDR